jgi:hypothetical protein
MAVTVASDVFIPEVIADITTDILFRETHLINSPYVVDGTPNVYRDGGNTLTFPYWDTDKSAIVQDSVETRTGVTPSKITMDTYTETVRNKIVSFDFSENALEDILQSANPNQHVAEIVASESMLEIQANLISKANGTNLVDEVSYVHGTAASQTLTVDAIGRAKMAWGEKAAGKMPGLFVHSKQFTDLIATSDFKNLGTATTNNAIVQAQAAQNAQAMVHGVLIYLLDSITLKGGTVSSITRSSQVATLTTAAAHNFVVGDSIVVSGATQTEYNGTFTITGVTDTTLTYTVTGSPATPATGSPVIAPRYEALMCLPGALNLVIKSAMRAQGHTHAGSNVVTQDFKFRYATTLRRVNPRGVVRFSTR